MEKVLDKQVNIKEFEFVQQAKKKAIENLEKLGVIVKEPQMDKLIVSPFKIFL